MGKLLALHHPISDIEIGSGSGKSPCVHLKMCKMDEAEIAASCWNHEVTAARSMLTSSIRRVWEIVQFAMWTNYL